MMYGYRIRAAQQTDFDSMAKVRVETWRATYKGIVPDAYLENLLWKDISERWQKTFWTNRAAGIASFVAENELKEIIGLAICGPERGEDPGYQGEIYILYVLPAYQRQGVGRKLISACAHYFINQLNFGSILIWVIEDNPYRKFYEYLGGTVVREKKIEIGGKIIQEVSYGWDAIQQIVEQ